QSTPGRPQACARPARQALAGVRPAHVLRCALDDAGDRYASPKCGCQCLPVAFARGERSRSARREPAPRLLKMAESPMSTRLCLIVLLVAAATACQREAPEAVTP